MSTLTRPVTDRNLPDRTLQKELEQLSLLLKQFAKQAECSPPIQALANKEMPAEGKEILHAEVVFLVDRKEESEALKKVKQWLSIDATLSQEELFNGKINGNININNTLAVKLQAYHFDYYPIRKLSEDKKILKIVVYDSSYKELYKNWALAEELLAKDPAVCLAVNLQPVAENQENNTLQVRTLHTQTISLEQLETPLAKLLEDPALLNKITLAKQRNQLHYLITVYQIILTDIREKTRQLQGRAMVSYKKQWQNQQKDADLSSRDSTHVKWVINTKLKQITKAIEDAVENFEKEDESYSTLEENILSFFGFVEGKSGKSVTFKMSDGAIQDKIEKTNEVLTGFYSRTLELVNDHSKEVQKDLTNQLNAWKLQLSLQEVLPQDSGAMPVTKEFLLDSSINSGKSYEKQVPYKGIGGLLTEMRTPLMMLMPFMMIFALFGALIKGESKGNIDNSILFYNNRPSIAITQLPESWDNEYRKFINEVEEQRGKKNLFHKEISTELVAEPQLAVREIEVPQSFGDKTKIEETLDYFFDDKSQVIYLYLNENADRNFVIEKLFDPSAKLLTVASGSTRTSFGMSGIIRTLSRFTQYRYLIIIGVSGLIAWFVITRKRSMDRELKESKEKEQKKLNEDLKQHLDKNLKQQMQRWKIKLLDQIGDRYLTLQQNIETYINKTIEARKEQKAEELKIIQKRVLSIKNDKALIVALKSEQRKIQSKLEELRLKIARLT